MRSHPEPALPAQIRPTYAAIVALTDRFRQARLTYEYQMMWSLTEESAINYSSCRTDQVHPCAC